MSNYKIAHSPLSNSIFAGRVDKNQTKWIVKNDVTVDALFSVAHHVIQFREPVELRLEGGKPQFRITVEDLRLEQSK